MSEWIQSTFTYAAPDGSYAATVLGYVKYPWGIDQRTSRAWHITHLPSGFSVQRMRLHTLRDAQAMVAALEKLPVRWNRVGKRGLKGYPKEVRDAAKAIAEGR